MGTSYCCRAPARPHGARRRRCAACGATWTVRPRRRGRRAKRVRVSLARTVLRCTLSLRGLAECRGEHREALRKRFHKSLRSWLNHHPPHHIPADVPLVAVADALWFALGRPLRRYGCFVVLLRPLAGTHAFPALLVLRAGKEGRGDWEAAFSRLPPAVRRRIVAFVSDGWRGGDNFARLHGWRFQWCHAHMQRKMAELRGVRNLPGKLLRQEVARLLTVFLTTPEERNAERARARIHAILARPDCPASLRQRLVALRRKHHFLRTYRRVPLWNLPVTTNSVESVNNLIRDRFRAMRGVRSVRALRYWLTAIFRTLKPIACRGYQDTMNRYRNSVS